MARRRYYSRGRRSGGGGFRRGLGSFAPALGGAAENIVNNFIPIQGAGTLLVGYGLKNQFCKDYGLYQIGYSAVGLVPGLGGLASGGNGGVML